MIVRELITRFGFDGTAMLQGMNNLERKTSSLQSGLLRLGAYLAAAFSAREIIRAGDEVQSLEARIAQLPQTIGDPGAAFDEVAKRATLARQSIESYGKVYLRTGFAAQKYLTTQEDVFRVTDTINKALVVGGATTQEQSSALLQFSQALASGVLQGEELRAMAEAAPQFIDKLSEALKIPREDFKKMASQGEITTKKIVGAIGEMSDYFDERFKKMPLTFGQAWTIIGNKMSSRLAEFNRQSKFVERGARVLVQTYEALERVVLSAARGVDALAKAFGGWEQVGRTLRVVLMSFAAIKLWALIPLVTLYIKKQIAAFILLGTTTTRVAAGYGFATVATFSFSKALLAVATAMKAIPIMLLIFALSLLVEDIIIFFMGGNSITGKAIKYFKEAYSEAISTVADGFQWLHNKISDTVGGALILWQQFKNGITTIFNSTWEFIQEWGTKVLDFVTRLVDNSPLGLLLKAGKFVIENVESVKGLTDAITPQPQSAPSGVVTPALRGAVNIEFKEQVAVNVPPGTSTEQALAIDKQVRMQVRTQVEEMIRSSMGDYPEYA